MFQKFFERTLLVHRTNPVGSKFSCHPLLLLIGTVLFFAAGVDSSQSAEKPNVILILADDMGPGELSSGGGLIPTPALDLMVSEGMSFTDAHTSSSVCTPTRYGILTGRYNWRSRLKRGVLTAVNSPALMDPDRLNLPQFMRDSGYHTACIGKWHLGADWVNSETKRDSEKKKRDFGSWSVDYSKPFKNGPIDMGFDQAFFILSSLDMPPYTYLRNDKTITIPTIDRGFPHNEYNDYQRVGAAAENFEASDCLADWASESRAYIKKQAAKNSEKPFFLYLPLTSPHTPVTPGKKFKGRYKKYSWYADFIAETDWVVGEVLEQLKASGVDENTLVIFTSDNGFAPYVEIPKMFDAGYKPSGIYRGSKAMIYEGGHRVPFLVRWPKAVEAGVESDTTICTTDFFATFADILGRNGEIPENASEDSFSFYPSMKGETDAIRPFTIHHSISGKFAIRKGDWKLILAKNGGGGWGLPYEKLIDTPAELVQLFNLKDDIGERKNLENTHPEKIEELVNDLAGALKNGRTTPGKPQANEGWPFLDKALIQKFPQLGE